MVSSLKVGPNGHLVQNNTSLEGKLHSGTFKTKKKVKHDWLKSFGLDVACSFRAIASIRQDKHLVLILSFFVRNV